MKKKNIRAALTAVIAIGTLFGPGTIISQAADPVGKFDGQAVKMISQVFDAEYYAAQYPDVAAALGKDKKVLLKHYLTCGILEGRDASATFNADAYACANADIVKAFDDGDTDHIDEYINFFMHYINCGKNEGRISTVADATSAGYTVSSVNDSTKVIAAPTVSVKYTGGSVNYSAGSSNVGSSNGGSAYVAPSNGATPAPVNNAPAAPAAPVNNTPAPSVSTGSSNSGETFTRYYSAQDNSFHDGLSDDSINPDMFN